MQKWSPDPLVADSPEATFVPEARGAGGQVGVGATCPTETAEGEIFLKDQEQLQPRSVLDLLNTEQLDQLRAEVARQLRAEFAAQQAQAQADQEQSTQQTLSELSQRVQEHLQENIQLLSRQTAGLAIAVAEKIVRRQVQLDPEVIERTLQTILFKLEAGAAMTLRVHPADAAHLRPKAELLQSLQVAEIKEDRRVERGGCLIQADRQEWDATLAHQLNSLAEIVQEVLAVELSAPGENGEHDAALE